MQRYLSALAAVDLLLTASTFCNTAQAQPVEQWGLFEIAVPNARSYKNPFTDVTLEAVFSSPAGQRTRLYGFYDGEQTWRLR